MATATAPAVPLLTFEDYMAEEVIYQRYDIIEGVRYFMAAPSWQHQRIQVNIVVLLRGYESSSQRGLAVASPIDVLIRRLPRLQTRQPDVLFISHGSLSLGGGVPSSGPLTVAPEIIVEIVSSNERETTLHGKLTDYTAIGVAEAWVVRPDEQTVEVLTLTPNGPVSVAVYATGSTLQSAIFHDLAVPVADFFLP